MSGRSEIVIGLGCYAVYLAARQIVLSGDGRERANHNARLIHEFEARVGVDVEQSIQRRAAAVPGLLKVLNAGYVVANVGLSVGWLIHLYRTDQGAYRHERRCATLAFLGALPAFVAVPTSPPRDLDGFADTLADQGIDLGHPFLTRFYNPVAAMPSHHMALATVSGLGLAARSRGRWSRAGWCGYPVGVAGVVVATGNHFVADVVAGAALGLLARRLSP